MHPLRSVHIKLIKKHICFENNHLGNLDQICSKSNNIMTSQAILVLYLMCITVACDGQLTLTPRVPKEIKNTPEVRSFYYLWEYSLKMDGLSSPAVNARSNQEVPKTLVVPSEFAMANLVPQDAEHPLYLNDPSHKSLRIEFLQDHLIKMRVDPSDPELSGKGKAIPTMSGKTVIIRKNPDDSLFVDNIEVERTLSLKEGTQIYLLRKPLFNLDKKVQRAFEVLHRIEQNQPIGPPLDIPGPPAPPLGNIRAPGSTSAQEIRPPALPEGFASHPGFIGIINAPAPPPLQPISTPISSQNGRLTRISHPTAVEVSKVHKAVGPPGTLLRFDHLMEDRIHPPAAQDKILHSRVEMSVFEEE